MKITVNNSPKIIDEKYVTVSRLLEILGVKENGTAVAVNERLIRKDDRPSTPVSDGDAITIITAAFGG